MTFRIEIWSHQTGWYLAPCHGAHPTREAADEWVAEMTKPGRRPLRLPAEIRVTES
jgi:hypothetical protein